MADIFVSDFSRLWLIENRAGPANPPTYMGLARAGQPSWPAGGVTVIRNPSPTQYGGFVVAGKVIGEDGNPELPVMMRYLSDVRSTLLRLRRSGCDHDLQVHMGTCQSPTDFDRGWDKILILEGARPTDWGLDGDIGALDTGDRAVVNEEVPFTGLDLLEIVRITFSELGAATVIQEINDVSVCDQVTCGLCGLSSDGCQIVFALQDATPGSPGLPPRIHATKDGGGTLITRTITSHAANVDANAIACVGTNLVVVSAGSGEGIHYATIADILNSIEAWTKVQTGLVLPSGAPHDLFSLGASQTWIVGAGGYIYKSSDITSGVTVQSAGSATVQQLNAIHGSDSQNLVAVGQSNAVVRTTNGGVTWSLVVGPSVGVNLNTVWVRGKDEWFVGNAAGNLYYTRDGGTTWTLKAFPGSAAGVVRDIAFSNPTVGYLAHDTAAGAGRILRTVNGGQSWYVAPEGTGNIPTNQRVNALSPCADANVIYGGGLGTGTDGFLVKGA